MIVEIGMKNNIYKPNRLLRQLNCEKALESI